MLLNFFDNIINKIYYSTQYNNIALYISIGAFVFAVLCFMKSIKKKDDKHPISWGWFIVALILVAVCVAYSFLAVRSFR